MTAQPETVSVRQRLLTVRQAADYLGLKPTTLYDWVARRKIPCVKLNGALRFDLRELERLIESSKRPAYDLPGDFQEGG
jgi:excisionase family DNA binding protein